MSPTKTTRKRAPKGVRKYVFELTDEQQAELREALLAGQLNLTEAVEMYQLRKDAPGYDVKAHLGLGHNKRGHKVSFYYVSAEEQEQAKEQWQATVQKHKDQSKESYQRLKQGDIINLNTGQPRPLPPNLQRKLEQDQPHGSGPFQARVYPVTEETSVTNDQPTSIPTAEKTGIDDILITEGALTPDEQQLWTEATATIERLLKANVQLAEQADAATKKLQQQADDYQRLHLAYAALDKQAKVWQRDSERWHEELHRRKHLQTEISKDKLRKLIASTNEHVDKQQAQLVLSAS